MTATLFDSHRYAKRLVDAGVPEKAADVQAEMMVEIMMQVAANTACVNKQDNKIDQLDGKIDRLDAKIDRVEAQLKAGITEVKAELARWVIGASMLQMAFISALKLLS